MAVKELKLMVFAHLGLDWAPCGQLLLTEEGPEVLASSFSYGLNYARRTSVLEVDPVSLSLRDRAQVLGKRLLPANGLTLFGGIRDAAPDSWGRRVIEAKLKVPANSLPESEYLLHAGSERFLHLGVGPQGRLATLDNALESHEMFTLSRASACEIVANVWQIVREWRVYFESFGVTEAEIEKIAPAFRHLDDVSTMALRRQMP